MPTMNYMSSEQIHHANSHFSFQKEIKTDDEFNNTRIKASKQEYKTVVTVLLINQNVNDVVGL